MAAFDSTGSTLTSTTLEGAVMEACQLLQDAEASAGEVTNNMAVNYFSGDNVVNIAATMPFTQSVNANGSSQFVGTDYLNAGNFTAGGGVGSSNLPGACLELLQKLQVAELASTDNPNNVTITYDTEAGIATIAAEFGITFSVVAGGNVQIAATEYLN